MKILMVNKFLYPKGGAETYVLKLGETLKSHGHDVQYFGLRNEKNIVGNEANAYVSHIDFSTGIRGNLLAPFRIIYSVEARKKIRKVLDLFQPDVVHLNNIHFHLTPSIILEIQKYRKKCGRNVKIVYSAHDFQLLCPSHGLFDCSLQPCEKCLNGNYIHCLKKKCIKNSISKSFLGMIDGYFWRYNKAYSYIDTIICCSNFLKMKLDTNTVFRDKTVTMQHFVDHRRLELVNKKEYILEFGHLSKDKGTYTLLAVAKRMPEKEFVFAGYGEAEAEIEKVENAKFVGFMTGADLWKLIAEAQITICPSICYETFCFSVAESISLGTPVIGSYRGSIPELIQPGKTGELFEAGDVKQLEAAINKVLISDVSLEQYVNECKKCKFETFDSYYRKLMTIYGEKHENI